VEKVIRMRGTGHKGRLPPVVERALSLYACHGRDGSGIARRREGFWFRVQRSEDRGQRIEINRRKWLEILRLRFRLRLSYGAASRMTRGITTK
jgi:hypothetical protein